MNYPRFILIFCLLFVCLTAWARLPSPPSQPASGPGSSDYFSRGTIYTRYSEKDAFYWIITPDDPKPELAPIAIFLPGSDGDDPSVYRGWLDHLARRGFIVLYAVLPDQAEQDSAVVTQSVLAMIASAKTHLSQITTTVPAWELMLFIGHGTGGVLAYNLACDNDIKQMASPKALFIVQPFRETSGIRHQLLLLVEPAALPAGCSTMLITCADDDAASDADARLLGQMLAASLPADRFASITIRSDRHGNPPLLADHYMAYAKLGDRGRLRIDALDWLGIWKLADRLANSSFAEGKITVSEEDLNMGSWSDGLTVNTPVLNRHE